MFINVLTTLGRIGATKPEASFTVLFNMTFNSLIRLSAVRAIVFAVFSLSILGQAPRQEKLLNGLKVLMWNDDKADKVSLTVRVHSGSAFDPQGKEGVMKLLAQHLFPNKEAQ